MADRDAVGVGNREADPGMRTGGGKADQVAAQVGIEDAEPVCFAGPFGQPEQRGQRDSQIRQNRTAP